MLVNTSQMPTSGYLTFRVNQVDIPPLTFGELMQYLGDEQLTPLREYVRALKYLINHDPGIGELSILDADYILYLFKSISASKDTRLTLTCKCRLCGKPHTKAFKLNQIEFLDVSKDAMRVDKIKLMDREVRIKYVTISEFIEFVGKLGRFEENRDPDLVKLASMLDLLPSETFRLLDSCVQENIALINYLDEAWFKLAKPLYISCPNHPEERGTAASFEMSAVDIFRTIIQLHSITPDQISFRKVSENTERREDDDFSG